MPLLLFGPKSSSWWAPYVSSAAVWTQSPVCPSGLQAGIPRFPVWTSCDGRRPSSPDVPSNYDHKTRATGFHLRLRYITILFYFSNQGCSTVVLPSWYSHQSLCKYHSLVLDHSIVLCSYYMIFTPNILLNGKINLNVFICILALQSPAFAFNKDIKHFGPDR